MKRIIITFALMLFALTVAAQTNQTMVNSPGGVQVGGDHYPPQSGTFTLKEVNRPELKAPWVTEYYWSGPDPSVERTWGVMCAHGSTSKPARYRLKINDGEWLNCNRVTFDGRIPRTVIVKRKGRTIRVVTKAEPPKYAHAQEKKETPKPEVVRIEAPAQQQIAELQRLADEANLISEVAKARKETAQQKLTTAIYKAMADAGCPTSQCVVKQSQQDGIYFERVKLAETAAAPAAAASPGKLTLPAKP